MKRRSLHVSWLIAWASFGLILGSFLALTTRELIGFEWLISAATLSFIGLIRKDRLAIILFFAAGGLIGINRAGSQLQAQDRLEQYIEQTVIVSGRVSQDPSVDVDGDQKLRLKEIIVNNQSVAGEVWLTNGDEQAIKRSDILIVEGVLKKGFGTIPAAMYGARIVSVEREAYADIGRDIRDNLATGIRESIQEPEASLGAGFLLGQKSALPEKLENDLRLLGLTHIVVASGYNLTILVRFARRFFARVSRFSALALSGLLVLGFAQMTGFSPSMSRAALITGLSLLAWYFGRKFHPIVLLAFSAGVTVFINPSYAWGDLGWLLSFCSFAGVIMLAPVVNAYFWGTKKPGNVRQVFIETMSAQVLTLPIIAMAFGQYSTLAMLANMLILPFIPIAMLLTALASIGGMLFSGWLSPLLGWPAEVLLRYMTSVIARLSGFPVALQEVHISPTFLVVFYTVLFGVGTYLWRRSHFEYRNYNVVE